MADLLRSVEFPCLLSRSGGELTDHIFICISEYVNILRILKTKVDAVECKKDIADELVLVIGSLAEFWGC